MHYTVYQRDNASGSTELIYVSQGIGGPDGEWMTVRRLFYGTPMHRICSVPLMPTKEQAQAYLDAYAKKKKWGVAQYGYPAHDITWEEAHRR